MCTECCIRISTVFSDLMLSSGCTPLDVATATIRDNQELALALEESQLENVVTLLVAITTSDRSGSQELPYSTPGSGLGIVHSASFSVNYEWNPRVGGKCLEFLQCAVWVDSEWACVCVLSGLTVSGWCVWYVLWGFIRSSFITSLQTSRSERMPTQWCDSSYVTQSVWVPLSLEMPWAYTQSTRKP